MILIAHRPSLTAVVVEPSRPTIRSGPHGSRWPYLFERRLTRHVDKPVAAVAASQADWEWDGLSSPDGHPVTPQDDVFGVRQELLNEVRRGRSALRKQACEAAISSAGNLLEAAAGLKVRSTSLTPVAESPPAWSSIEPSHRGHRGRPESQARPRPGRIGIVVAPDFHWPLR